MSKAKTVLVVEDDALARDILCEILRGAGYAASGVGHGAEALEAMRRGPLPNLVLLDLLMPVMDGWQFRREQRRDPTLAHVPVVVISGAGDAAALGAAGFLDKPVEPGELLGLIRRVLRD
jgi:CheY-like chemotaxis protein